MADTTGPFQSDSPATEASQAVTTPTGDTPAAGAAGGDNPFVTLMGVGLLLTGLARRVDGIDAEIAQDIRALVIKIEARTPL